MSRKGFVKFLVFGGLLAVILKYVFLIIPITLTIIFIMIVHRNRLKKGRDERRVFYIRRR